MSVNAGLAGSSRPLSNKRAGLGLRQLASSHHHWQLCVTFLCRNSCDYSACVATMHNMHDMKIFLIKIFISLNVFFFFGVTKVKKFAFSIFFSCVVGRLYDINIFFDRVSSCATDNSDKQNNEYK